jgi:hypothetical protein
MDVICCIFSSRSFFGWFIWVCGDRGLLKPGASDGNLVLNQGIEVHVPFVEEVGVELFDKRETSKEALAGSRG